MTIAPITLPTPLLLELTKSYLLGKGIEPLILGMDSNLRFQVLDDTGAAISLTDCTIEMVFTPGSTTVTLSTANLITGSTYEIKIDAEQGSEVGNTGKGWYQVNNSSNAAFVTKLTSAQGRGTYVINITFPVTGKRRHLMGAYEIL
jgi:hypothetical protein